jgi:hypothetical protein
MIRYGLIFCALVALFFQTSCEDKENQVGRLTVVTGRIGGTNLSLNADFITANVPNNLPVTLNFSSAVDTQTAENAIYISQDNQVIASNFSFQDNDKTILISPTENLLTNTEYSIVISNQLRGAGGERFQGATIKFKTALGELKVLQWTMGGETKSSSIITDTPLTIDLEIRFTQPLNITTVSPASIILTGPVVSPLQFTFSSENKTLTVTSVNPLKDLSKYRLVINDKLKGTNGETFSGFILDFYTVVTSEPKFPLISDEALLTKVQQQTFKYFWDFAHPSSGMARERNTSGDIVTSGGTGFGIMSMIVGIERNFITRQAGVERLDKILDFLETADRFHGVWPHWLNGTTGKVIPFSPNDNGGDLVETAFLILGLLTFRQYLSPVDATEQLLIDRINTLWGEVEWDWYTREGQDVLYWHWSPDKQWIMNHEIQGYNEALIVYVLAASSPTHGINATVYEKGWANSGGIVNGKSYYGITLPLGFEYGGPLFFAHYSFLGLDPRNLNDAYADYWTQNVNHSRINHAYSAANPKKFVGYSDDNWGLTASDNHLGYSAHSPTNDLGVITPSAALSSFPYTPEESMKALHFFYYKLGDRLWGEYGFYDAFNITEGWTANSYLAIDQGPIIVMIENYRTALLWDLFMSAPEVGSGLDKLSFTY